MVCVTSTFWTIDLYVLIKIGTASHLLTSYTAYHLWLGDWVLFGFLFHFYVSVGIIQVNSIFFSKSHEFLCNEYMERVTLELWSSIFFSKSHEVFMQWIYRTCHTGVVQFNLFFQITCIFMQWIYGTCHTWKLLKCYCLGWLSSHRMICVCVCVDVCVCMFS